MKTTVTPGQVRATGDFIIRAIRLRTAAEPIRGLRRWYASKVGRDPMKEDGMSEQEFRGLATEYRIDLQVAS